MEKTWNLKKKTEQSWKNHGILCNNLTKLPVARKLAVRHTKLVCLTASFLAMGGFKFLLFQNACIDYNHAYLNTLPFLHFAFTCMLCMVKMLLKGRLEAMH